VAKHIRAHVNRRQLGNAALTDPTTRPTRIYPTIDKAVETRCATAKSFPGNQWLSEYASRELVTWGTVAVPGGVQFRHDPRLQWPSIQYWTNDQVEAIYQDIQCPTALILAESGWPFDAKRRQRTLDLLQPTVYQTLPGSHHFHADPETAEAVSQSVIEFATR
jgi:pimeloyl-ACP methyl ester carboxylesterase